MRPYALKGNDTIGLMKLYESYFSFLLIAFKESMLFDLIMKSSNNQIRLFNFSLQVRQQAAKALPMKWATDQHTLVREIL